MHHHDDQSNRECIWKNRLDIFGTMYYEIRCLPVHELILSNISRGSGEGWNDMKSLPISEGIFRISRCPVERIGTETVKLYLMRPDRRVKRLKVVV